MTKLHCFIQFWFEWLSWWSIIWVNSILEDSKPIFVETVQVQTVDTSKKWVFILVNICMPFALILRQRAGRERFRYRKRPLSQTPKLLVSNRDLRAFDLIMWSLINSIHAEFPAVLLNLQTCIIEAEFHTYIRPTEQPTLSKFCTDFTGITQANVEGAVPLKDGLVLFDNWLHQLYFPKGICLMDEGTRKQNTVLVTWSDYDLGVYLCDECDRKNIARPNYFDQWIDARQHYRVSHELCGEFCDMSNERTLFFAGMDWDLSKHFLFDGTQIGWDSFHRSSTFGHRWFTKFGPIGQQNDQSRMPIGHH